MSPRSSPDKKSCFFSKCRRSRSFKLWICQADFIKESLEIPQPSTNILHFSCPTLRCRMIGDGDLQKNPLHGIDQPLASIIWESSNMEGVGETGKVSSYVVIHEAIGKGADVGWIFASEHLFSSSLLGDAVSARHLIVV